MAFTTSVYLRTATKAVQPPPVSWLSTVTTSLLQVSPLTPQLDAGSYNNIAVSHLSPLS